MKASVVNYLKLLNATMLESLKASNEKTIVKNFVNLGVKLFDADFGFAWYKVNRDEAFHWMYKTQNTPYTPTTPRKKGVMAKALGSKKPVLIEHLEQYKNARPEAKDNMKSVAVIPMMYQGKTYGNLVICYKKKHRFNPEERTLCEILSNSAAQAITINRLYSSLTDFKNTLDSTLDSIFMFDPKTFKISYANRGASKQIGYSSRELYAKTFLDLQYNMTEARFNQIVEPLRRGQAGSELFETILKTKGGTKFPVEVLLQHIKKTENQSERFLSIVRDVTERKGAEEAVKLSAFYDPLTKVANRTLFTERLTEAHTYAERTGTMFAILFTDLDKFKFINDVLGHILGDKLLHQAAQRLVSAVKRRDTVSRMGGDEFVILVEGLRNEHEAHTIAKRILEIFKVPFNLEGQEVYVNISMGISVFPLDAKDIHTLLKNADIALHRAKEEGGANYQQYHTGIPGVTSKHLELEKQLRHAIENKELVLYYQPQVDLATASISGAEALIRWKHPSLGLIYPSEFIHRAEETGYIVQIGEWIFNEVARQNKQWQDAGLPLIPISVNLSPRQLLQQDLVGSIMSALKNNNLDAKHFQLELTESVIMKNVELSISVLEECRRLGIQCLIDDFGIGQASLSYLKRIPADMVKIDRSFVQSSTSSSHDAAIIKAIIAISHQMSLKVVAEGVETTRQLEFLHQNKCDHFQGHLYSRPLPPLQFAKILKNPPVLELPKSLFQLRNLRGR